MKEPADAVAVEETIEIVSALDRLLEIGPQWRELAECAGASIFQSHAWVLAWARTLTPRQCEEPCIVVAWKGDVMQAVAPFAIHKKVGLGVLEWAARECSDYCDTVLRPGVDAAILRKMWQALEAGRRFDLALLRRVRPDACVRALAEGATEPAKLRLYHREITSSQLVSSAPSGDAWFAACPKKFRQNYRRGRAVLEENASLNFRLLAADEPLPPVLERLAELKRLWLGRKGVDAPLFAEGGRLLPALIDAFAREGALRVFVIERDAQIIAISVNCEHRGALLAYLTSYDPAFSRGSPGMVLMVDYIKWALDNGLNTIDFLCGDEAFKDRFATQKLTLGSLCAGRTLLGKAALTADTLRGRWRSRRGAGEAANDTEV